MAYKSFLTYQVLDEPKNSLDDIMEIVRKCEGHLDIVVIGTLLSAPLALYDVAPAADWVERNREIYENIFEQVDQIEKYVAEKGISANVAAECDYLANLEKSAARYAFCSDIHIAKASSLKTSQSIEKAFNASLFDAGCPSILLPDDECNLDEMSKIAIAWDGKAQAASAVRKALPMLKMADRVNIVVVDPIEAHVGQDPGSDLAAYLSRFGINITVDVLASGGMSISEKLLQRATDIDADLIVMGGYGHTKFREWLFGGTTREMLDHVELPLFIAH